MEYEELDLSVYLWRRVDVSGVFLCYKFRGLVPVGLDDCGSRLFDTDLAVDEALIDAHIAPSVVGDDEKAPAVLGLRIWQLKRLGLKPEKARR